MRTAFPVGMARGATWDPELERRVGAGDGRGNARTRRQRAARAGDQHAPPSALGPRAGDLRRGPATTSARWASPSSRRAGEHVIASAKHFAVNSIEDTRFTVDVTVDERTLREVYLPHFKRAVDAGVGSVMSAYNQVNGAYCAENPHLLARHPEGRVGLRRLRRVGLGFGTRAARRRRRWPGSTSRCRRRCTTARKLVAAVNAGEVPRRRDRRRGPPHPAHEVPLRQLDAAAPPTRRPSSRAPRTPRSRSRPRASRSCC